MPMYATFEYLHALASRIRRSGSFWVNGDGAVRPARSCVFLPNASVTTLTFDGKCMPKSANGFGNLKAASPANSGNL